MATASPQTQPVESSATAVVFAHLDFILSGVVMTLLGPMLPILSAKWALNDSQAGYFFIAQWVVSIAGMLSAGWLVRRIGYRLTLLAGLLLMAIGIATLAQPYWTFGLVAVCVFGLGTGLTTPTANLLVGDANPTHRASAVTFLNASWGVGATACPFLVAAFQRGQHTAEFLCGLAIALGVLAAAMAVARFAVDGKIAAAPRSAKQIDGIWTSALTLSVAALFFIYVGTETCIGGWVASYAHRIDGGPHSLWAIAPSFFWGAILAGRVFGTFVLRRIGEIKVAGAGVALAAVGVLTILAAEDIRVILIGTTVAGFGLSSVYPINVSLLEEWFGSALTVVSGVIFSVGNLGGAALPWAVGALSTRFGGLRAGFVVPLAGAGFMLAFYFFHPKPRVN
jgi:fucose permease